MNLTFDWSKMNYSVKLIKEEIFGIFTVLRRNPFWKYFMENYQCFSCKMVVVEHTNSDYLNSKLSTQSVLDTVSVYNSLSVRMSVSTLSFQASILILVNYVKNSLSLCTVLQQI